MRYSLVISDDVMELSDNLGIERNLHTKAEYILNY